MLPFRIKEHSSRLLRSYDGIDRQLQINKVHNLKCAVARLNGIVIKPGEVFSFYRLIGWPNRYTGYRPGVERHPCTGWR